MNKNPFLPAPNFTPQQPPLPPGPPPPQPNQADYSAWWAGAAAQQQHIQPPSGGPYNPQWTAPQPSRPSVEQSALYANYGYGTQNNHWQRQQQQQQQQQYHPPPQVMQQQPPPPPSQPSYNPYQPTAGYAQPYAPSGPAPPQPMVQGAYPHPSAQPQQMMFAPPMPPQQPQQHHQQQPQQMQPRHHHGSPQHPPAKRQRFDGPSGNNRHHQLPHHHHQPPQPQFQPPPAPPQTAGSFSGPSRGGPPSGPSGRGGGVPLGPGGRGGNAGSRGGRGGSMSGSRGAMGGGRGRGGSFSGGSTAGRAGTGSGPPSGPMRGNSRSNFSGGNKDFQNRRGGSFAGGGSYQGQSFRGRNQMGSNRGHRNDGGGGGGGYGARENTQMSGYSGKKDENRRTLTDFKVIGLAIPDLAWTWGTVPSTSSVKAEDRSAEVNYAIGSDVVIKDEIREDSNNLVSSSAIEEKQPEVKTETFVVDAVMAEVQEPQARIVPSDTSAVLPPPSRIRIYFHTPVTADDSRPIPHNSSFGEVPSDGRKGKRKKLEDDDGDLEERRVPPPPQRGGTMNDDRSSVGASVDPSIAETASEADWLMAAIVDGEEEAEAEAEGADAHDLGDEDDGSDPLHVSHIVKGHEHEMPMDDDHVVENEEVVLGGTSHDDGDVNMVGQAEHNLREPATSESTGQIPIESAGGVTNLSNGSLSSLHLNGDHSAVTKPPSVVDALNHSGHADVESATPEISVSSVSFPSSQNEDRASESVADHPEFSEKQFSSQQSPQFRPKSLEGVSADSTLLDLDVNEATQTDNSQMTQIIETQPEHLPELALSSTQPSISSATALEDGSVPSSTKTDTKAPTTPSANRLSISYARGNRRLVLDAEVVESLKLHRQEGRIDVVIKLAEDSNERLKGILMEGLSEVTKSYSPLSAPFDPPTDSDPSVPPFWKISVPSTLHLTVYLDTVRPLSEPKWAKTGDIQDWLKSILGRMFWAAGDAAEGWEKKIQVVDPDPPPTIWTVLDGWSTNSPVGAPNERQRFLKTHMTEIDNILEILLRLVRGERATAFSQSTPTISAPSISGPLLSALTQGSAHSAQQTHVSLAVLAMFQLAMNYAQRALGDKGKTEAEEHIGEIIRCLPSHLIYKSLDGIFKEWRVEKKGR